MVVAAEHDLVVVGLASSVSTATVADTKDRWVSGCSGDSHSCPARLAVAEAG